jgi:hypothetical protein
MGKSNPTENLNHSISLLEKKKEQDFLELKQHLRMTGESLKPANLLKGAVRDITRSSQLKGILIKAGIGLALGLIAKKLVTSQKRNAKNRMLGNALQYGISFLAAKRNNMLKAAGIYVANQVIEAIRERRMKRRHLNNGVPYHETSDSL